MFDIRKELDEVPHKPGVYIMHDDQDEIIYVGKAIDLIRRLSQYFDSSKKTAKVRAMVSHIDYFEYIIVNNEVEALILESNLIKKNRPKYNIVLRDDKQYPYIKITNEKYPRVLKTRRVVKDGAKYFGPYPNAYAVNDMIALINHTYHLRTCNLNFEKGQKLKRPCLNYFIDQCQGPCVYDVDEDLYKEEIKEIESFLNGKEDKLLKNLEAKMLKASREQKYELAAKYRDYLKNADELLEKQNITNTKGLDMDMISMAREVETVSVQIFFMRNGKIIERQHYIVDNKYDESNESIMSSFFKQYYLDATYIPKLIITDIEMEDKELIERMLESKKGSKVEIRIPQRGTNVDMLEMVKENAKEELDKYITRHLKKERNRENAILDLTDITGNEDIYRLECYDISNISGVDSVGSMIVFKDGEKSPKDYRKFKIKTIEGADDYGSHREVLTRRFKRYFSEDNKDTSFSELPSIIFMDGGKGQVNVCKKVLREFNLHIDVMGLVKDDKHKTRAIIYENQEIPLKVNTPLYRMLFAMQEETHRFAINYHRKLHEKRLKHSELDDIKLIGEKRKVALMRHFKSIENIKKASLEEIRAVEGMNDKASQNLYDHFNGYEGGSR
ncbi:MAG: excinuclease ABC subunit UvrC [Finegoldia sp.]|nr:excinuclease ABC subunit UvrC [Finegoldia sp.]